MNHELSVLDIKPTVFFQRTEAGGLEQQALLTLENRGGKASDISLAVSFDFQEDAQTVTATFSRSFTCRLVPDDIVPGISQHVIYLPDVRHPAILRLRLLAGMEQIDECERAWLPQKHWEIYLVHGSHHDLGYTDIPSNVLLEHDRHLDQVVAYCEQTEDWDDDVQFRYVVEQAWSVLHYLEHRPPDAVEKLVKLMQQGRIEVTAFFDNLTSELCGHEQQVRAVYPAFRLQRRYGIPIRSAEHNDIPGISWGLVSVLAGCGVRYFAPAVQDYFAWGFKVHPNWDEDEVVRRDQIDAFWWQGPDGSRVLLWYGGSSIETAWLWAYEHAEGELPALLERLTASGYASDIVRVKMLGGRRDNAPPDLRISTVARQWNERWAYPRLRVSTNSEFFERFERQQAAMLRVLRGDLPNTDYPIGATSHAKEVAVNRRTHDLLPAAEKFAAWASAANFSAIVSDYSYPAETLAEACDCSLYHDGHCGGMAHPTGPAQEAAWAQKNEFAYRAAGLAHDVLVKSTNLIADQIRLDREGCHIVVFNSLAQSRTDLVRMMVRPPDPCGMPMHWRESGSGENTTRELVAGSVYGRAMVHLSPEALDGRFSLVDTTNGKIAAAQLVRLDDPLAARPMAAHRWALGQVEQNNPEVIVQHGGHLLELVFIAEDVPPVGYKVFHLAPAGEARTHPASESSLRIGDNWLENEFYRLELDRQSGAITSLYDRVLEREWLDQDSPHGFNQLLVRSPQTGTIYLPERVTIQPGETGPLCASLVVKAQARGCPQLTCEITLYDGIRRIDFANRLLKDATPLLELYFAFPFSIESPRFRLETSNAVIEPVRDQLPGSNTDAYTVQHWVSAWDENGGVAWSSLDAPVVTVGDLWPGYVSQAHHGITPPGYGHEFMRDPDQLTRGHIYSYVMNNNFRTNFDPVQVADVLFRYALTSFEGDWREGNVPAFGWGAANPLETVCIKGPQKGVLDESASFCSLDRENVQLLALKRAEDGDGLILRLAELQGLESQVRVSLPLIELEEVWLCDLVERNLKRLVHGRHEFRVFVRANGLSTVRCRIKSSK